LLWLPAGCRSVAAASPLPPVFKPYRFDDEFGSAEVLAAKPGAAALAAADPVIWHNFLSENDITWTALRGRIGFRQGDLVLKGAGATPVIMAPAQPFIEWNRYEAVEVRMLSEGGHEIKIKIGDHEFAQKLGPPGQYNLYRFDINLETPAGSRPLLIMPTDGLNDLVTIRSIELVPRKSEFGRMAGRMMIGKREEYRNTVYIHSPSSMIYEVTMPRDARLHFGMGITDRNAPAVFHVSADGKSLYSKKLTDADRWEDADVDLASYSGRKVKLAFETDSTKRGTVALWANPLLTTRAPKNRPNVLIYMIDTLRADHTSLSGYARDTTPYLKRLSAEGLAFDDCIVQATWTKPSVASLMTSLYSFTHGIIHDYDTIPQRSATLAEQLRAAGYVTAGIVANPMAGRISSLQRGFDYMSEWLVIDRQRNSQEDRGTDSAALNRVVFPWLDQHRDEPFFLYAHSTDPHAPYQPPAGFEEKFAKPAESPEFDRNFTTLRTLAMGRGGFGFSRALCNEAGVNPDRFIQRAVDRYDGEVLHNDWSLEQLSDKLKALGILDNTLIIVVSDHGEEFWDHGWTGHGQSLYQELAHGVLVMWGPKLIPVPRRVSEPVQLIDVMPTVLDLLGLKIPDVAQGQSLAPFAKRQTFQRRGPVMTSRYAHPYEENVGFIPENHIDSVALIDGTWKLIYRPDGKSVGLNRAELYEHRTDRGDTKNVAAQNPQQVGRMAIEIGQWMEKQKQIRSALGRSAKSTLDQETLEKLRSLGYLGGKP
jgi:arylsulfatase A-like enzyme